MIRIFLPVIFAVLGLAAASCSQSDGPLDPAAASGSGQPTPRDAAAAAMASPASPSSGPQSSTGQAAQTPPQAPDSVPATSPANVQPTAPVSVPATTPDTTPAERRASTLIGMPVTSADGGTLGEVKDIIFDRQGRATHLVIAYGTEPPAGAGDLSEGATSTPGGKLTAMPWDAAMASIKDGRLVLDGAKLQGAPSFTPDSWPNLGDPAWSAATDAYWRKAVRAAIAAHPGTPIDSTSRRRGRRARDGDGN